MARDGAEIVTLQVDHAYVRPESTDQLADAHVDCIRTGCTALKQSGSESARAGPDVGGDPATIRTRNCAKA